MELRGWRGWNRACRRCQSRAGSTRRPSECARKWRIWRSSCSQRASPTVDGDHLHLENQVGLATVELDLRVVERPDADLAYEQADGFFETMDTVYTVEPVDGGTEVTATTDFELDVALVGAILDATVIKRQRRHELTSQFDWLAERLED
jgi:hypothetical protein